MAAGYLRLRFYDDGDGTGKLVARAEANGFAGEGGAYFDKGEIERFATNLGAFPLPGRTAIAGGFFSRSGAGSSSKSTSRLAVIRRCPRAPWLASAHGH